MYDTDEPNTLLVLYYAGHSKFHVPGELILAGSSSENTQGDDFFSEVKLSKVQDLLMCAEADVLGIFDCCFPGGFVPHCGKDPSRLRRFETLRASPGGGVTRAPGPSSFTAALIWSLKAFAKEDFWFTTLELVQKIREAPHFPSDQLPYLVRLEARSNLPIVLHNLSGIVDGGESSRSSHSPEEQPHSPNTDEILTLNFVFGQQPMMAEVQALARGLNKLIQEQSLHIKRIEWAGLRVHPEVPETWRRAVNAWRKLQSRKRKRQDDMEELPTA